MDPEAFDSALDDLDVRLGRLRLLYEQLVAGDEQLDPTSLQKDIGRRIARLTSDVPAETNDRLRAIIERYESFRRFGERLSNRMKSDAPPRPTVRPIVAIEAPPASPPRSPSTGSAPRSRSPLRTGAPEGPAPRSRSAPPSGAPNGAAPRSTLTPPLGTPAQPAVWTPPTETRREIAPPPSAPAPSAPLERREASNTVRALYVPTARNAAPTIQDLRPSFASDTAITTPSLRPPVTETVGGPRPQRSLPTPQDTSKTIRDLRPPFEDDCETVPRLRLPNAGVTPEVVLDLHARLREASPPGEPIVSVERLTELLRETEERLRATYGDRTITFDVITKDGKPAIKPIVR